MNSAANLSSKRSPYQPQNPPLQARKAPLRIGLVGGVERSELLFQQAAKAAGYDLEFHGGHTAGRGAQTLASMINRVDLVVIVTDVNSHNAVVAARKLASSRGVRCLLVRRSSPSRLIAQIRELDTQRAA